MFVADKNDVNFVPGKKRRKAIALRRVLIKAFPLVTSFPFDRVQRLMDKHKLMLEPGS